MTFNSKDMEARGFPRWIIDGKRARRAAKITQSQLARLAGVSIKTVGWIESTGECGPRSAAKLQQAYADIIAGEHTSTGWYDNKTKKRDEQRENAS